ncbi:hypothetical protein YA0089_27345 [Pseudomonas viridiflava]|uniref:hypothetical protein n=1 Tax=Pseudomonas viridiflava TaxID=33069 RepID=UPI0018E628AA|nr:hypothetical protein [Pseudomonas viridiflava]MBI6727335.1 hypothetical protein [Pseudomonas viridiflava]
MTYQDCEVLGLDDDGCVVQWDAGIGAPFNSGLLPEDFGLDSMTLVERERINCKFSRP